MLKLQRKLNKKIKWLIFGFGFLLVGGVIFWQIGVVFEPIEFWVNVPEVRAQGFPSLPMPSSGDTYQISTKYNVGSVSPANLDGDEFLDWIVRSNIVNKNPTDHIMIEARKYDGTFLWEYDTGIEKRNSADESGWHEAIIVWNIRQDTPWDEVIVAGLKGGTRYVTILDGKTGQVKAETLFPEISSDHNRHYAAVAYWDGEPHVIITQGIYSPGQAVAYDGNLNIVWRYRSPHRTGQHGIASYDLDGDGNDEILYGGTAISYEGKKLWAIYDMFGYGHVDETIPGDILPGNGKNEVYFPVEENGSAALLVDQDGNVVWHWVDPCKHPGGIGGTAYNFISDSPGDECTASYDDCCNEPPCDEDDVPCDPSTCSEYSELYRVFSANGEKISYPNFNWRRWPEWTGDDVYDLNNCPPYGWWRYGHPVGVDLGGGDNHGAEEVLYVETDNTIRVIFNKDANSYPSRWQNRHYRQDAMRLLSGYAFRTYPFRVQGAGGQPPTCTCSVWQDDGKCQDKGCRASEVPQKRTCTPAGCYEEKRCVERPSCLQVPSLFLEPSSGTYRVGDKFKVEVRLNTNDQGVPQPVVGVSSYLNYDKTRLEAVSINSANSVFPIEAEQEFSNALGLIKISRGRATPGVSGNNLLVAEIEFEAIGAGEARVNFSLDEPNVSRIIKDDGFGTDILEKTIGGVYQIGGEVPPTQTCAEQGGDICETNETCPGTLLSASDTNYCCSGSCILSAPTEEKTIKERLKEIYDEPLLAEFKPEIEKIQGKISDLDIMIFGNEPLRKGCRALDLILKRQPNEIKDDCERPDAFSLLGDLDLADKCETRLELVSGLAGKGITLEELAEEANPKEWWEKNNPCPTLPEVCKLDPSKVVVSPLDIEKCKKLKAEREECLKLIPALTSELIREIASHDFKEKCEELEYQKALKPECDIFKILEMALENNCRGQERGICELLRNQVARLVPYCLSWQGAIPNLIDLDLTDEGQKEKLDEVRKVCALQLTDIKTPLEEIMGVYSILLGIKSGTLAYKGIKTSIENFKLMYENVQKMISAIEELPKKLKEKGETEGGSGFSFEPVKCLTNPAVGWRGITSVSGGPVCPAIDYLFSIIESNFAIIRQNLAQINLLRREKKNWDLEIGKLRINLIDTYHPYNEGKGPYYEKVNFLYEEAKGAKQRAQDLWALGTALNFANQNCTCGQSFCKLPLCVSGLPLALSPLKEPYCYLVYILRHPLLKQAKTLENYLK